MQKNCGIHTFCVLNLVPPHGSIFATDLSFIVIRQNRKQFNTTAGVQKLWQCMYSKTMAPQVFRNYVTARSFYRAVWCQSFWTPAVVLICLRFCRITITLSSVANIEPREHTTSVNSACFVCPKWRSNHHHSIQGAHNHHLKPCLMSSTPTLKDIPDTLLYTVILTYLKKSCKP